MDPTSDPNFLPPSRNHDFEPPAPLSQIPTNMPIQPLVLADLGSEVDAPAPHPLTRLHKEKEPLAYHLKIPRRYNELMNSLSDEDQNGKHEEDHKNHPDGEHKEQPLGEQEDGRKTLQLQPVKAHVAQANPSPYHQGALDADRRLGGSSAWHPEASQVHVCVLVPDPPIGHVPSRRLQVSLGGGGLWPVLSHHILALAHV